MIVIVCGMHRTGSSALSGMLHMNGIVMGEQENFKPKPHKNENPKGFFENRRFSKLNDDLLEANSYLVVSFDPKIPKLKITDESVKRAKKLIKEYNNKYKVWGWKDPRTSLTMPLWRKVIKEAPKVIVTQRSHDAIANSMKKRGNKGTVKQFKELSLQYYHRLFTTIGEWEYLNIYFDKLCKEPQKQAEIISDFLSYDVTDVSFIDSTLKHN